MNKQKFVDKLKKKINKEYNEYIKNLRYKPAMEIISYSNKTVFMRKCCYVLSEHADGRLEDYEIEKLLKVKKYS